MDDADKALEALKIHLKKEIIDNYFADRVCLEEESETLNQEVQACQREADLLARRFLALYQALGSEGNISLVMDLIGLKERPFYPQFQQLGLPARQELLRGRRRWGLSARRRFRNLIFDLYEELWRETAKLAQTRAKIVTHLRLLTEDIAKFNLAYDFGLIAAQIEALEGREVVMPGGLGATEREELSTRLRLKRPKLTDADLPPIPALPPLTEIKRRLAVALKYL